MVEKNNPVAYLKLVINKFGGIPSNEDIEKYGKELNIPNLVEVVQKGYDEIHGAMMNHMEGQDLFLRILREAEVSV